MERKMGRKVFEGINVADFSWAVTGPMTMKFLADYGATVVHIETSTNVDLVRVCPPFKDENPGLNTAGWFLEYNSSKLGISLNMKRPRGIEIAKKLVAWADIVAASFVPGAMERLGLGYEDLKKIKPDIIAYFTCNMGQTGPRAKQVGYGAQLAAHAGFFAVTGWPDRSPVEPFGAITDYTSVIMAISAVAAALDYRRRTGKGQLIDLSQLETGVFFQTTAVLDYIVNKRVWNRRGNRSSRAAPHGAYRCRGDDRWCAIAVYNDEEWEAFCRVMGNPVWTRDTRFSTLLGRIKNAVELDRLVEEWTVNHSAEEVMALLQEAGVPAGVVENSEDAYRDPQFKHRHHFWELEHAEMGKTAHPSLGFGLTKTPEELKAAHCLGEHTEYVCTQILGMSDMEFTSLLADGVFE
jgi:benzylsuccinate CoA-transferase BbsF subunit